MPDVSPASTLPVGGSDNLPVQVTRFVGREREIAEVGRLLATTRLLTLTGAGGCGKTRLALRIAADALPGYPDGAWLVELAAVADPALVPQTVAFAVGARELPGQTATDGLVHFLRGRTLLLLLDNCEHVVDAAARLADALLRSCPSLRVLATSREALGAAGETAWRVPSLALPPSAAGELPLDRLAEYEAIRLFVDRARAANPAFAVTAANAPAIADVCGRLDGIPLAIELAAARVRVVSAEQIAARLDDRFRLLTAGPRTAVPRQQTLRATVDWSYDLLSEPERALLRRLAVFAGGWTFEAAEAVAAGDGLQSHALLDLLAQLVDKSLVIADEQRGAARYRLLETLRQYAHERLAEAGEAERTRDRHLAHFLALAEEAEPALRGAAALAFLDRLAEELDNLRAALEWSLRGRGDAALRLSGALAWFWWARDRHTEGRRWLARALAADPDRSAARMKALHGAGWLAHHQRDLDEARALLDESLAIARGSGDRWTEAFVLHVQGRVAYFAGDPAGVRALGRESLAVAEEVGDDWLTAWPLHLLGIAAYIEGDYPAARAYYERSLAIRRAVGFREGVGVLLCLLGIAAVRERDLARAHAHFREALTAVQGLLGAWGLGNILACFAGLAGVQGDPVRAVRLAGACAAVQESWQTPGIPLMEAILADELARARRALGEDAYAAAWADGRAMSLEEGVADALALEAAPAPEPTASGPAPERAVPFGELTATEARVLRLMASGRTSKEIAGELVVAVSTVDRHLTHVYQKLGVRNRAEATAFALTHGLA
jgi:predicted ATPase/DNA-binding CsgD family transcriptional regulator